MASGFQFLCACLSALPQPPRWDLRLPLTSRSVRPACSGRKMQEYWPERSSESTLQADAGSRLKRAGSRGGGTTPRSPGLAAVQAHGSFCSCSLRGPGPSEPEAGDPNPQEAGRVLKVVESGSPGTGSWTSAISTPVCMVAPLTHTPSSGQAGHPPSAPYHPSPSGGPQSQWHCDSRHR